MSEADSNNNAQVHAEEQNGSPSKHNKNAPSEEVHNAEEEPHSESGNVPRVEPNLFTLVVHAILESDRENGVRFDTIWKFIKSHFAVENERRKAVRATVDEALETGELIEDEGKKIRVNFAAPPVESERDEVPEEVVEETAEQSAGKKRRTKRPAMKRTKAVESDEADVDEAAPETPRRGRKRAREASPSPSPKKRGRPAKRAKTEASADVADTPRRRGRPAKPRVEVEAVGEDEDEQVVEETPKRRGRPAKKGKSPARARSASPKKNTPSKSAQKSAHKGPQKSPSKSPKKSPKKSPNKTPSKGELDLPKGWRVEEVQRKGGRTKGHTDQYWYSPEGVKFRSRVAVLRHLEEQQ